MKYLDFDYSEDVHDVGVFEAMVAMSSPLQLAAARAEVVRVLAWAHEAYPDQRAPLDEGGEWDYQLDGLQELTAVETLDFDVARQQLVMQLGPFGPPRHSLTLSLMGTVQFCVAFRAQFEVD